jgi:GTPase SAR1 family protein
MMEGGYSAAQQKVQALLVALRSVARLVGDPAQAPVALTAGGEVLPGLGLTSDAANLSIRARDMEQGIFKVLVLGEFKNGKSTLLNAMLGHKTLPARAAPATAILTELVYGESEAVLVFEAEKPEPRRLSWAEFVHEFQLNEQDIQTLKQQQYLDRFQHVEYARIECQHRFCANGVRLIDSPGLGEHISRTRVTINFLKQSQAVIIVLSAISILSEAERAYIERLGEGRLNQVFFVINRINQVEPEEIGNIKHWVQQSLQPHFLDEHGGFDAMFYARRVFFVNAKGALDARMATPHKEVLLEESGVPALEEELERFLTSDEKLAASLAATVQTLATTVASARKRIAQQKHSLGEPLQELERRRAEAEQQFAMLGAKKEESQQAIQLFGENIKHRIYTSLIDFIEKMRDTWPEDSLKLINLTEAMNGLDLLTAFFSQETKEKVVAAIKKEIRTYLQVKLTEWAEGIPALVQPEVKKLLAELATQVEDFERELAAINAIFATGAAEQAEPGEKPASPLLQMLLNAGDLSSMTGTILKEEDWEALFGKSLQDALTVSTIFSFFGGVAAWGWIFLLIDEFLMQIIKGPVFSSWVLKPMGEKLHEQLAKEAPKHRDDIYRRVDERFGTLTTAAALALQAQIEEARRQQQAIIRIKEQEGFAVEQEKRRLDLIGAELLALLAGASQVASAKPVTEETLARLAE